MHFGHTRYFLSALCYSFARVVFVFAFACLHLRHQIGNRFKDKEEFEQWLTAFGRHQVKNLCDRALWRHRLCTLDTRAFSCLPFVTLLRAWFLSSPLPASTFATSSSQIENKFKDEEECEQWLTAFGCRDQEKEVDQLASGCHRYTVLNLVN